MRKISTKGFTLIELMVAVGLFSAVMLIAVTAYLTVSSANRQAQAIVSGTTTLSFALENMVRTIRTGTNYLCNNVGDCTSGATLFTVTSATNVVTTFTYDSALSTIRVNGVAIVDPPVRITGLTFYASGTSPSDAIQPNVLIVVTGTVPGAKSVSIPFSVETSATMRGTDI